MEFLCYCTTTLCILALIHARDFQCPTEVLSKPLRYFTHGNSHSVFLLAGLFQILSLHENIFLSIVPFPPTFELLSHSHFVVACLFQREINQGLLRKEIVHKLYILV